MFAPWSQSEFQIASDEVGLQASQSLPRLALLLVERPEISLHGRLQFIQCRTMDCIRRCYEEGVAPVDADTFVDGQEMLFIRIIDKCQQSRRQTGGKIDVARENDKHPVNRLGTDLFDFPIDQDARRQQHLQSHLSSPSLSGAMASSTTPIM